MNSLKTSLVWNSFIRMYLETAFEMILAMMILIYAISFEDWYSGVSTMVLFVQVAFLALLLAFIPIFLSYKKKVLRRSKFKKKYGSLMLALTTVGLSPKLYQSFFLGRRIILAILIVFADELPFVQISVLTMACLMQTFYIGYFRPFELPW